MSTAAARKIDLNFCMSFPEDHDKEQSLAQGLFANVSTADFGCCAGAIDGILIWIHKPSLKDCKDAGCSQGKFFCGRKKVFRIELSSCM